jgi:DNA-binding response OmpR family regulator
MATILVVDDDPKICRLIEVAVGQTGHKVLKLLHGTETLSVLEKNSVDLVICDIMMPGMDGFSVCESVRRDPRFAYVPFIFLSARSDAADRLEGIKSGGDDFLGKPFSIQELTIRVNRLLMNQGKRRGLPIQRPEADPLKQIGLTQLVTMVARQNLTGDLIAQVESEAGTITFQRGRAIKATFRELEGEPAIEALLGKRNTITAFSFEAKDVADQVAIAMDISRFIQADAPHSAGL